MYIDWTKQSWSDFYDSAYGKGVILWGCGQIAEEIIDVIGRKCRIIAIVDSNPEKIGESFHGYTVQSPEILSEYGKESIILICSLYLTDISKKAEKHGFKECYSAFFMSRRDLAGEIMREIPSPESEAALRAILSDGYSQELLSAIIEKRRHSYIDYSDLMTKPEYLLDDIFSFSNHEVYIDCGAFDGDTVLQFIKHVEDFDRIIAFEADSKNYARLQDRCRFVTEAYGNRKTQLILAAVSENSGEIFYTDGGAESAIVSSSGSGEGVKSIALDDVVEKATYIKMDIEGCEKEALLGAKNLIQRCKPKLSICVYHRSADLWELPLLIHSYVPEYKMYIRHHGNIYYDTVLYATV